MGSIEKALARIHSDEPRREHSQVVPRQIHGEIASTNRLRVLPADNDQFIDPHNSYTADPNRQAGAGKRRPLVIQNKRTFTLPDKTLKEHGMITPDAARNQLSEEYRAIKRRILTAVDNREPHTSNHTNLVMVTSCVSGEGKTFSAINLAISLAMERDRTVLLIDADVTNPVAGERLGFNSTQSGLTDLLLNNNMDIAELTWQSSIPNLQFLPAGAAHHQVTELLSSRSMVDLAHDLSQRYRDRVIIVDSPPLLMTSEASVVADLAGQIVFVVAANSTTKGMVTDALKIIDDHSRIGFLLNKTKKRKNNLYGYGYGYGHK